MAVDYEKAFNRLDHAKCIEALEELGGRAEYIAMVKAFLFNRKMTVKVGDSYSDPKTVNGGAPKGSILGCFLFCATINILFGVTPGNTGVDENIDHDSSGMIEPPSPIHRLSSAPHNLETDESDSDNEITHFFRWSNPRQINDTLDASFVPADLSDSDRIMAEPVVKSYIDDFNVIESLDENTRMSHYTTNWSTAKIHAPGCGGIFENLSTASSDLGMKINPNKTQTLCISTAAATNTNSFFKFENKRYKAGTNLKS